MDKPVQIKEPDFNKLRNLCQLHLDFCASADFHGDNDDGHYIYEEAMEAIFGKDVFKFINERIS
tara:strand:- start:20303 stop:20494 length:192 start_codon:yes stop_codon:yes gene_type:complete